MDIAVF